MRAAAQLDQLATATGQPAFNAPAFSVVVPAHNEEAVIGRCLRAMIEGASPDAAFDLVVVANGCTDRTIEAARMAAPMARVIELATPSKAAAINAGLAVARHAPVMIVDADIVCPYRALAATALALGQDGAMAASPAPQIDLAGSSRWVRSYYAVWQRLPYATEQLVGGGVYGLSRAGLDRIGQLPPVIADDLYVRTRFHTDERRSIALGPDGQPVASIQFAPRRAIDLIRIEARRLRGKRQVDLSFPTAHSGTINGIGALVDTWRRGTAPVDISIYAATKLMARALHAFHALTGKAHWSRDLSSRYHPAGGSK